MNAEYTTSLLYPGNPYVEALPPMLAGQELIRALASVPLYSTSDRDRSTGERLQLLSALYEFYQPLTMTLDLYCEVYNAMQHCYGQYTPQREAASLQQGYAAMQGKAVAASIGGGNSFSVVGVSGLGKSTALQRVLSLFPQIIHHERYNAALVVLFPYIMVKQSKIKWDTYVAIAFLMCVLNVTNVFDVGQLGNVVYPIVTFATTLLLVREKPIAVMAWTATVLIAQIVIDLLVNTILIVITGQDDLLLELNLQRSPGFLAICLLVKLCDIIFFIFVTRKRISTPISDKIILRFLLLPVLSAIIGMVMVNEMSQGKASGGLFLLLIFFMILCDIIAVDLMFATSKSVKQVVEAESKVKINEISKTQYLRLAEKSDTIRTWKHDTREAMNGALLLMQQGRTAEAELLLKDRLASMQVETIAIKSGNIIVDAILTQKIDECLDNGIVLDMKVEIPSHIMREEDTCEVFGSILDFAVAVSNKQPTDKKIKIVLQDQDNKLKVFVTANAAVFDSVDATRMTEIEQSTTKILSAYNGIVSAQHDEDQSTITWNLLIPLPQDNEWLASYIYDSSEALSSGVRTVKQ